MGQVDQPVMQSSLVGTDIDSDANPSSISSPNKDMTFSPEGYAKLRFHEGVKYEYYNDPAGNCTFGIGTLVHMGSCTKEEFQKVVTPEMVNDMLQEKVIISENVVKKYVENFKLRQDQFDALVSFVYNRG